MSGMSHPIRYYPDDHDCRYAPAHLPFGRTTTMPTAAGTLKDSYYVNDLIVALVLVLRAAWRTR